MGSVEAVNKTFLATVVAGVAASFLIGISSVIFGSNELVTLLVSQLVYFLPTGLYLWKSKRHWREAIRLRPIKLGTVCLLVCFMYLLMPAITLVNAISLKFTTNVIDGTINSIVADYPFPVGMLMIAVVPSILEEWVYRGVFFNEYRKISPKKAILLSGFLFGLTHMNFNQFLYAFLLGMVFSIVVEATDSILASMALHFVMNGTSVAVVYFQGKLAGANALEGAAQEAQTIDFYIRHGWTAAFVGAALAFLVLKAIAKSQGREEELGRLLEGGFQTEEGKEIPRLATPALWLGIAVCLGIMLFVEVL